MVTTIPYSHYCSVAVGEGGGTTRVACLARLCQHVPFGPWTRLQS